MIMESADSRSKAGESTRRRKSVVWVADSGKCTSAAATGLAIVVAIVVVAVLDVVGCGGRNRRNRERKVVAVVNKHGLVVVLNQRLKWLR